MILIDPCDREYDQSRPINGLPPKEENDRLLQVTELSAEPLPKFFSRNAPEVAITEKILEHRQSVGSMLESVAVMKKFDVITSN